MQKFNPKKNLATLQLIFLRASKELFPNCEVEFDHSLNNGIFGYFIENKKESKVKDNNQKKIKYELTKKEYKDLENKIKELISLNLPIKLITNDLEKIKKYDLEFVREDVKRLLKSTVWTNIRKYELDGYIDYVYQDLYKTTGIIKIFALYKYGKGFILKYPKNEADILDPFIDNPKMAEVFTQAKAWNKILDIGTAGSINEKVLEGNIRFLIRVNEALHNNNISKITENIISNDKVKLISVAGPSSSGKTTFSNRLCIHLKASGKNPLLISLDNYYVGRKNIAIDENGEKDFESLKALDVKLLNKNLSDLLSGKQVELPIYSFVTGEREKHGKISQLPENGYIVIEGIHALNEELTMSIPKECNFKVYISCLTQVNIDIHNRISTSDVRKIRRIVRDGLSRSTSVYETLDMWSSVRRGEEKNIFPYQENADVIFNSELVYEIGVLKRHALKELIKVEIDSKHYLEAKRLINLISCFVDIESSLVPDDSILKEFIGDSFFYNY